MDIRDFEGTFKYKLILPSIFIFNWTLMLLGPLLFPLEYLYYTHLVHLYTMLRSCYLFFSMLLVFIRTFKFYINENSNKSNTLNLDQQNQIFEAFIIPSYKQDIQLLSQTLKWIASHKNAKERYLIFLAMEKHQQNSSLKALELIQNFREKFKVIQYTLHQIRQNQQKGKASNVSWCVQRLEIFFQKYNINPDNVMLTIIDADSWIPPLYIQKMEEQLLQNFQKRDQIMFIPPQIFTRNHLDVPAAVRIQDLYLSIGHTSNLVSLSGIHIPLSNYTLSYNLIKKIGFWDTCEDAIGQDFHTMCKAFWKSKGQLMTKVIYVPFNQINIQTGNGYLSDIRARFWQSQRHGRGVADVAYNINIMIKTNFINWRSIGMIYFHFDAFYLAATSPWITVSALYQFFILDRLRQPPLQDSSVNFRIFMLELLFSMLTLVLFDIMRRYINKKIYKRQNDSIFRFLQTPIMFLFVMFFMLVPSLVVSSFGVLFKARTYRVAEKVLNKRKNE